MGGADNICSDKTGTLTKNIMSVTRLFAMEKIWTEFKPDQLGDFGKLLSVSICQNSNATPELFVEGDRIRSNQIGNKTECALLEMALRLGFNYKEYRNKENIVKVFPFSSKIKSMSTVSKHDGGLYTFSKGAPDFVIKTCSHYINKDNKKTPINDEFKKVLNENLESFAALTLRTLLICYKEGGENAVSED